MVNGNTFEALGLLTQPERNIYGMIFYNVKTIYQIKSARETSLVIDGKKIPLRFTPIQRKKIGRLSLEAVAIKINKEIYNKIIQGSDILITVGGVKYNLDQDNIDAFLYFDSEVQKDLKRRNKTAQ